MYFSIHWYLGKLLSSKWIQLVFSPIDCSVIFFCKPKCVNAMHFAGQVLCMLTVVFLKGHGKKKYLRHRKAIIIIVPWMFIVTSYHSVCCLKYMKFVIRYIVSYIFELILKEVVFLFQIRCQQWQSGSRFQAVILRRAACFILQSSFWVNQVNNALE